MKHTSSTAVSSLTLTLLLFLTAIIPAPFRAVAGDGKQVVVEGRSSGKQVVVEKPESSGKQVVVEQPVTSGKQVVVEQPVTSGKQVVVRGDAGGKQVVVKDIAGGTVAGRVFDDSNADGTKGSDESYLATISVKLLDADDKIVAATKTNDGGIYLFQNIDSGQYQLEFYFGDNKTIESQPFAVTAGRSSVIVEPVPYFNGFDFDLKRAIKVHRIVTSAEIARLPRGTDLSTPPQRTDWEASPFRP